MKRRLSRPRTKAKPPTRHMPDRHSAQRRKFLKIAAWVAWGGWYVVDGVLKGWIHDAAKHVATLLPKPAPRALSLGLDGGVYELVLVESSDRVSVALSEARSTTVNV